MSRKHEGGKKVINTRRLGLLAMCVMLATLTLVVVGLVLGGPGAGHAAADAGTVHVDGDVGTDSETCGTVVSPCQTIQHAVASRVDAGGVVSVAAGTYLEQVVISKALTLRGAGPATVIESPDLLTVSFTAGGEENYPVVIVQDVDDVVVRDLIVDGAGKGNVNYRFFGVGYHNAGGTVEGVEIRDVRDTPFSSARHGVGLYVHNDDGVSRSVVVTQCDIHGFQKNGLALNANPATTLTVHVQGNGITGRGATTVTVQNAIQVAAERGTGTIVDNTVEKIAYDNTNDPMMYVASSILNVGAALDIRGNTVREGHVGVYNWDGAGEISENTLEIQKVGLFGFGVIASDPPSAVPSPFGEESAGVQGLGGASLEASTLDVTVSGNVVTFSGVDNTDTHGIEADAGYGPDDMNLTIKSNSVAGFGVGIEFRKCESGCAAGVFNSVEANYNRLSGNTIGLRSNVDYLTVDAMNNWWGCNEGPSTVLGDCDTITGTGMVEANPWLVLELAADPQLLVVDGGTSELTADLTHNSSGLDTSLLGHIPDGAPVAFTATLGTVMPGIAGTVDGVTTSTLTAGPVAGSSVVSATADNETVTTTVTIDRVELAISKTDGVDTARPGDVLTYTLTITNDSALNATGIVVTDTLPVSTTYAGGSDWHQVGDLGVYTHTVGGLGAGESTTLSISVRLTETLPAGFDTITNTAQVADDGKNGPRASGRDDDVDLVGFLPDLVMAKENGVDSAEPGQMLTYTLTISNVGTQGATGVVVSDTLPAHTGFVGASDEGAELDGVVTWPAFDLDVGGSVERQLTVQVDDSLPSGVKAITNTAVAMEPGGVSDVDVDVDALVRAPNLVVTKSDGTQRANPGDVLVYTIAVTNAGTEGATGVLVTDTLPAHTEFVAASAGFTFSSADGEVAWRAVPLGVDEVMTRTVTVRVDKTLPSGVDAITNTVVTVGDGGLSASSSDVDELLAAPDLQVSKTDGRTDARAGEILTYTLTVENAGTQGATGVVLSDVLPAQTTFRAASHGGSLSSGTVTWPGFALRVGAIVTRTVTVEVDDAWPSAAETALTNTVSVTDDGANGDDPVGENNVDIDTTRVLPFDVYLPLVGKD